MLTVHLFGKFQIETSQARLISIPGGKPQELLCYVLLHREAHSREALSTALWPDCEAGKSKKNLRQVLWQLQNALTDPEGGTNPPTLCVDSESVCVSSEAVQRVDVDVFEAAYQLARGFAGEILTRAQASALQQAVQEYRGDLLEGCYQDWCLVERERLQNCYLTMLDKLIAYSQQHRNYQQGIDFGERVLALDRAHERSHQQLMRLHYLGGNRTGALRQYERCKTALREDLSVLPSRKSTELYEQIRADQPQFTEEGAGGLDSRNVDILFHLERLLKLLNVVQTELKEQIRSAQEAAGPAGKSWPRAEHISGRALASSAIDANRDA